MRNFESENKASVFIGIGIVPLLVPLYKGTTLTGPEGGIPDPGRSGRKPRSGSRISAQTGWRRVCRRTELTLLQ